MLRSSTMPCQSSPIAGLIDWCTLLTIGRQSNGMPYIKGGLCLITRKEQAKKKVFLRPHFMSDEIRIQVSQVRQPIISTSHIAVCYNLRSTYSTVCSNYIPWVGYKVCFHLSWIRLFDILSSPHGARRLSGTVMERTKGGAPHFYYASFLLCLDLTVNDKQAAIFYVDESGMRADCCCLNFPGLEFVPPLPQLKWKLTWLFLGFQSLGTEEREAKSMEMARGTIKKWSRLEGLIFTVTVMKYRSTIET